jgi:hypothetical protein
VVVKLRSRAPPSKTHAPGSWTGCDPKPSGRLPRTFAELCLEIRQVLHSNDLPRAKLCNLLACDVISVA